MKLRTWAYVLAILALLLDACNNKNDIEEQRYLWSTDAPMSIPYRVRLQRFERSNLVRNPSFETGRIFRLDSNTTSFVIDGWQQVGPGVEWADRLNDSLFTPDEVYSGFRSVRITRKKALETDVQGEGILSDFIKVIPGNYSLSLFARLENVAPNRSRLGTRMFDAVNIRLQFYDRNKILMNPAYRYPHENQMIDASFKGLSFANYETVPEFGWGKITGKSGHFPFPEGDIPSDAHFVKIFIGLKGTGTLWVDSVMFNYTDKNFSIAERMQAFTDTAFVAPELFIPSPRKVTRMESLIFARDDMRPDETPLVVSDEQNQDAVKLIMDALQSRMPANKPASATSVSENQLLSSKLIISIGNTALYNRFKKELPVDEIINKPEGYFIYTPGDFPNLVILGANNSTGIYYSALTAVQMIDRKAPVFHNARIVDYPDYENRFCTFDPSYVKSGPNRQEYLTDELVRYKINGALALNMRSVNSDQKEKTWFRVIPVNGYRPPDDTLVYLYPLVPFKDSLDKTGEFAFPAAFHNEMLDNGGTARGVEGYKGKTLYSGTSFYSFNTDAAEIRRFASLTGSQPVFMDNSMRISTKWAEFGGNDPYYPGKIRLYNLFDPFSNTGLTEYANLLDTSVFVVNLPPVSEIEIIRLATAADYMWNESAYTKDYSLWKVLLSRYGIENARDLVTYADKYALLLETLLRVEKNIQPSRKAKSGQQLIVEITALTAQIGSRLGSQHNLVKELQVLNNGLRNRLSQNRTIIPARK